MTFESQKRRRLRAIPGLGGRVFFMHAAVRDPAYYEGYNDARDGQQYDVTLLGGDDLESEEYRAGYLQACAEEAAEGER